VTATHAGLDQASLRRAFGAFPSGVVAVAADVDRWPLALAASSFTSVSLEPPLVSVSVALTSRTWPALRRASRLGVSVLAHDQVALCRQLAGPVDERFAGVELERRDSEALLVRDAVVGFVTSVHREVVAGDHTLVLLRLHGVEPLGAVSPLVFHRSRLGPLNNGPAATEGEVLGGR
jgi:flavin reductase (DIM6/NTAB) family NADH-FMN oxidoreductase RutF